MKYLLWGFLTFSTTISLWGQEAIHAKIDALIQAQCLVDAPGLGVGVVKEGALIYQQQRGLANLEYQISIHQQTVFDLASITKQFTAACIGILAHQGLLNIQDDVRKHIPELPFYGDTIRIKHLLNHTSGLRNHNVLLDLAGFDQQHNGYTNQSIQKLIFAQQAVNHPPGEKMLYTNSNYVLLALIADLLGNNTDFPHLSDFLLRVDTFNNGQPMTYSQGLFLSPYRGHSTINHSGRGVGMRSQLICLPEQQLSIIIFTNSENINVVQLSYKILDLFIEKPDISSTVVTEQQGSQHHSTELTLLTGYYQELNSDLRMHIFLDNDTLMAQSSFGQSAVPLMAHKKWHFHRKDNPSVNYTFLPDATAETNLLIDFGGALFYFEPIVLAPPESIMLSEYEGIYYSKELDVAYTFTLTEEGLILNYPNNPQVSLQAGQRDEFGAGRRTKYSFQRNSRGDVTSLEVAAEGTVKGLQFEKID